MHQPQSFFLRKLAFLLVLQLNVVSAFCSPLSNEFRFRRYSVDQGLSQSQVSCVLQDHEGFVWLGTQDGLNRFDGYAFKVYRHDAKDSLSISDDYINCLFEDASGTLWIGTYSGGLNRYDRARDAFTHFVHDTSARSSIGGNSVWSITEDSAHSLWVGVWGIGLNRFDPTTSSWTLYSHDPGNPSSLVDNRVFTQAWDHAGRLWVGTFVGLDCLDPSRGTFRHVPSGTDAPGAISRGMVTAILEDRAHTLWVGTLDNGLNRFTSDGSRVIHYTKSDALHSGLSSSRIAALMQDRNGTIWIGTRDGGVNLVDAHSGTIRRIMHDPHDPNSLSFDGVISLYEDRQGGVWVGTDGGGVNHYHPHRFKLEHLTSRPGSSESLANPLVRSLCEDRSGCVWVGMMEGNLDLLDFRKGTVQHYADLLRRHGLKTRCMILSLLQDRDGNIWAGTDGEGIFVLDKTRTLVKHFRHDARDSSSIPDDYVVTLYESRNGAIWMGGISGAGLGIMDRRTQRCARIARRSASENQVSGNYVWAVTEDREGNFWIGTWGAGISVLDPRTSRFRTYRHDPRDPSSFASTSVLTFHEDASGTLWIGTLGGGLDEFDRKSGTFIHHAEADGLPNNTVSGILEDRNGRLWLSTNKGISCFDPVRHTFQNYDVSNGAQSAEFNQGAFLKARDGMMYFGGINGLNRFNPETIVIDTCTAPIQLTAFTVQDRRVIPERSSGGLRTIVIPSDQRSFACEFALLNMIAPEKNHFRYMLRGLDPAWVESGSRHYASYTNLPGGEYVLCIRARNSDGVWSAEGARYAVRVLPPYWETLWFRGLVVCMLCALGYVILHVRTAHLRREHAARAEFSRKLNESQETERRRIAGELHDSLGQDLLIIRDSLAGLAARNRRSTRLVQEVQEIKDSVQHTIEEVSKIAFELHPHMLDKLGLKKTLDATLRRAASSSGILMRGDIENVDACYTPEEQINIFRVIQEAVNNVIKHAHASVCSVTLRTNTDHCEITVEDNGRGFDADRARVSPSERGGYGLGNMEERVRFLHGTMQIRTSPGKGTTVVFLIPLPAQPRVP